MTPLPLCCHSPAFRQLQRQLRWIDSSEALLAGAEAVERHFVPRGMAGCDGVLQLYANVVRRRARSRQPQALLAHLHELLLEEEQFRIVGRNDGGVDAMLLGPALETRKCSPVILSVIYHEVARRIGICSHAVNIGGQILLRLRIHRSVLLVDVTDAGRLVTEEEADERLSLVFDELACKPELLRRPMSNRLYLTRIIQDLLGLCSSQDRYRDMAAMLEMEIALWPREIRLERDLALVLARCGRHDAARSWLDHYLKTNPDDPQRQSLEHLLDTLA